MPKHRVAVIGTGGTISAIGRDPFDLNDYDANQRMLSVAEILAELPRAPHDPDYYPVEFLSVSSTRLGFVEWWQLVALCSEIVSRDTAVSGIVIIHGTATLEETAFFLDFTLKVDVPVVLVGAQRPWNGLSSDGPANLRNAIRVAASPDALGNGVLVVLNDEIHAARDVTKTSTQRLHTFQSPVYGALGLVDPDRVSLSRKPVRRQGTDTAFQLDKIERLPRVDIIYAHADGDDTLVRAALAAGAKGIVSAGFAPGAPTRAESAVLREAVAAGTVVVQSTRGVSGRVPLTSEMAQAGFISAGDLPPHKARILLALALSRTESRDDIAGMFELISS